MNIQPISLDRLFLSEDNPRFEPMKSQEASISALCDSGKITRLAEDIVQYGLNPLEIIGVVEDKNQTYRVVEGNRRLCALKLLVAPELAPSNKKKKFDELSKKYTPHGAINCVVFPDADAARPWLQRLHEGEMEGRGRLSWIAIQKARFKGDSPALKLLEYAVEAGLITKDQSSKTLTTFTDFLSNRLIRETLGFEIDQNRQLLVSLDKKDFIPALSRLVSDIADRKKTTRSGRSAEEIENYAKNTLWPLTGKRKTLPEPAPIQSFLPATQSPNPPSPKSPTQKPASPKPVINPNRINSDSEIKIILDELQNYKLSHLYQSITNVSLRQHCLFVSIGVWSFIETMTSMMGKVKTTSFDSFFSKDKISRLGLENSKNEVLRALERLNRDGNSSKHDSVAGDFTPEQTKASFEALKPLIINSIRDHISKSS